MSLKLLLIRALYAIKGLFEDPIDLFEALAVQEHDQILEIGCAIGYHTIPLARLASHGKVYAVDIWEEGLAWLKRKTRSEHNIEIILSSAEVICLPPASLDKILCFDTFHEIPDREKALQRWLTFLKKGGAFFYRDPIIPANEILSLSARRLIQSQKLKDIQLFTLS
jgi:ubiquinone/menaquinone biosynthesis C-methylase UbiE